MNLRVKLHQILDRRERTLAANTTAILTEALGGMLEDNANTAMRDAWVNPSMAIVAATYRDAADLVRISGIEIAETIRP